MADSNKTALQMLEDLHREHDELGALIQALEKRLGISGKNRASDSGEGYESIGGANAAVPPVTSMPVGFFHNLSQASAAEKLLRTNAKQALTTGQILEAFASSGMELHPKNAATILYTALKRSPKFARVGNKAWGLAEWYPASKKRASRDSDFGSSSSSESAEE